jgi:hypothetical protein
MPGNLVSASAGEVSWLGLLPRLVSVVEYLRALEGDETAVDHGVDHRKKSFNLFAAVDQLNDNWQIS